MTEKTCYLCDHLHPDLNSQDAKFILEQFKSCAKHKKELEGKIERTPGEEG